MMRTLLGTLLLAIAAGCAEHATEPERLEPGRELLTAERIAALGEAERSSWQAYLAASALAASADRERITREAGSSLWNPAPAGADFAVTGAMTPAWLAGAAARQLADNIISYQTPSGGWSKAVDFGVHPRQPGESYSSQSSWSWIATFDNGATTEQLRFLAGVIAAQGGAAYVAAFRQGLAYILSAQFPNGCWPQVYPLEGSYHDAVTFNDDVAVRVLRLLGTAARSDYPFLDTSEQQAAAAAAARGVECITSAQVVAGGKRTAWGQQHDPLTLVPVSGRAYEPAALSSLESARLADLLMELASPGAAVLTAVHAAAAWWRETTIYGYVYEAGELRPSAGAGPLWARFYQFGSNRPVFGDRDGSIHYDLREISAERRAGYAWYTASPAATLVRYDVWAARHPR